MRVSIVMVRALVAAAKRAGAAENEVLAAAGIDPLRFEDVNAQVSLAEYERVQRAAFEQSGDEALGLHVAEHASATAFDVLGHLTEHAATLRQSIETLARYSRIVTEGPKAELVEDADSALVRFGFRHAALPGERFAAELSLAGMMRLIRQFAGPDAQVRGVYFEHAAPAYRSEYTRIFGGAERFEHAFTGIEFERAWLDRKQLYENAELYSVLQTQADRALGRIARADSLVERVNAHLATHGPRTMPTMSDVAREFGMSVRSLRRRLVAEGAVYKDLVDQILMTQAKRMLENPRMSIQETAYATGFGTAAAFHRAFKRWTGMTPKAYKASF